MINLGIRRRGEGVRATVNATVVGSILTRSNEIIHIFILSLLFDLSLALYNILCQRGYNNNVIITVNPFYSIIF